MGNYRFDSRTKDEFKSEIKRNSFNEAVIALRLGCWIFNKTTEWPDITPTGTDYTGDFIESTKKVNISPDFTIGNDTVEITRSDMILKKTFHQKSPKVINCIKNGGILVYVNGFCVENEPDFLWLDRNALERFTSKALEKYDTVAHPYANGGGMGKEAYRYDIEWFNGMWEKLPSLNKDLPDKYGYLKEFVEKGLNS